MVTPVRGKDGNCAFGQNAFQKIGKRINLMAYFVNKLKPKPFYYYVDKVHRTTSHVTSTCHLNPFKSAQPSGPTCHIGLILITCSSIHLPRPYNTLRSIQRFKIALNPETCSTFNASKSPLNISLGH